MNRHWILIVDDLRCVQLSHRAQLKQLGLLLKTATTLEEARATLLQGMRFALVVLDYELGKGACGLSLVKDFREHGAIIVLCTGYTTPTLRPEIRAQVDEVMGKPLNVQRVAELLKEKIR